MKTLARFVSKFTNLIVAVLSCFDRVIFKGYLPLTNSEGLEKFVDHILKIRRIDFMRFAEQQSERVVQHAKAMALDAGREFRFLQGAHRKEKIVHQILQELAITDGLVCILCCMECCPSFKLIRGEGRPRLVSARRQQRVLYYYFMTADLGLVHVRLATWFPFTIQIYVNGHSYLSQQMSRLGLGFCLQDNAFTELDDPAKAQKLADGFAHLNWPRILHRFARQVNPLLQDPSFRGFTYYWVVDQAEYSTDVLFTSRDALAELYPRLLQHAALNFSARDIFTFLGRRWHQRYDGEVTTEYKTDRWPGARIKHRMKNNWLKMYDKFGLILRVETVINNPREFKVRRLRERGDRLEMVWCPMNKGVANLYRYQEAASAANQRYLEALSVVEDPSPAYRLVEQLTQPVVVERRSYTGFNPTDSRDVALFQAVLDGNNMVNGFRNADIRRTVFGSTDDPLESHRQSMSTGRQLKRLHLRGLIAKVPHTRRWPVSARGQTMLTAIVRLYYHGIPGITNIAA